MLLPSPIGNIRLEGTRDHLLSVKFVRSPEEGKESLPLLRKCAKQLSEYFAGKRKSFSVCLYLQGTPFERRVWEAVRRIPFGSTSTYREIAERIGQPKAARAVGNALRKNPLLIIVPCHRLVPTSGSVGGYAAGKQRKRWLLGHERKYS